MADIKHDEAMSFKVSKDNQVISWFDNLRGDELSQTVTRIPREKYIDQTHKVNSVDWDPNIGHSVKEDRDMLLLSRKPNDASFGVLALNRALERPILDIQTGNLKVFYPRFDHDGNLDINKSFVSLFSRAQVNSLQAVIDNFRART